MKTETIIVRLSSEEKAQAQRDAHRLNATLSEYVRALLVSGHNAIEKANK